MSKKLSKSKQKSLKILKDIEKRNRKAAGEDFVPKKIRMDEIMDDIAKVMSDPNYKVKAKGGSVKKLNMGGVMKNRGGTFKGVY